ncbi:MAG TPA: GlsB/YeaQ/YmgE family stress response membrane protein [Candidatus Dormibacteraeota bacterium]|nr:GlsB/YeaQ/YmgE family stress response membrane protein [Candidatus Dormibacteraeota bacterium]
MHVILFLIIGGLAGMVAGKLMSGHGYGIIGDVLLGIVGGIVGGYLVSLFTHHAGGGLLFEFLVALLGAIVLVAIARLIKHEPIRA